MIVNLVSKDLSLTRQHSATPPTFTISVFKDFETLNAKGQLETEAEVWGREARRGDRGREEYKSCLKSGPTASFPYLEQGLWMATPKTERRSPGNGLSAAFVITDLRPGCLQCPSLSALWPGRTFHRDRWHLTWTGVMPHSSGCHLAALTWNLTNEPQSLVPPEFSGRGPEGHIEA